MASYAKSFSVCVLFAFALVGLFAGQAGATLIQDNQSTTGGTNSGVNQTYDGNITATNDLVYSGSPSTLSSVAASGVAYGLLANINNAAGDYCAFTSQTLTFNLNTTSNTLGYDLSQIRTIAGFSGDIVNSCVREVFRRRLWGHRFRQ